jgi:chromosome segregation ATPase
LKSSSPRQLGKSICLEKEKLIAEKTKERRVYEGADSALGNAKKQLEAERKEMQRRSLTLHKELENCSVALGEPVSVDNVENVVDRVEKAFQESMKTFDSRISEITAAKGVLEQRIKELGENLSKLSSNTQAKTCPTCEAEQGPERVLQLITKYSLEKSAAETKLTNLRSDFEKTKGNFEEANQRLRQVASVNAESVHHLAAEIQEAIDQVSCQEHELEDLDKKAETLHKLTSDLDQLEKEKREGWRG